jgi:hypothetical protein
MSKMAIISQNRYVDVDTWPEPLWPQCCFGPAYVITPVAVSKLIEAHESGRNPFIPFEDVYVTGNAHPGDHAFAF